VSSAGGWFWARAAGELALAATVAATASVSSPGLARLALLPSLLVGATAGLGLVVLLARRLPPSPRVERGRLRLVALKAAVIALGSWAEEILWRWCAIGALAPAIGVVPAYVASTTGFALAHAGRRARRTHLLTGACFGAVYLATGRIAAAVAAHLAYNLTVLLSVEACRAGVATPVGRGS
jgi:membrane protease YdiL (CAAX protease family)